MKTPTAFLLRLISVAALALPMAPTAMAQAYPTKPIRLIVPDAPGGSPDVLGRLLAQKLADSMGQQIVVENRPGAAGLLAAEQAARAAPDGYTLFMSTTSVWAILPSVKKNLPYDADNAFIPISRIATASNVLVVNPALPVKSVADLVKLAKASPGSINYASAGIATPAHLAGEMLNLLADIKMTHVPYKGAAPALLDVIAGNVQAILTGPLAAGPHIANGKVTALATTGSQRNPSLPELPTIAETVPGYEISQSWGITVPAGTPAPIVKQLEAEMTKVLALPDVHERITRLGVVPATGGGQAFAAFIAAERKRLNDVISKAGIVLAE
ncbi:MAG: tripartite tricarboxylate transporter substrate binding protein [Burkholderiaceae bacterium]|nr:tripartite tricarboxylate transporter substrate binding protein [Rhodoferax sp.]MCP5260705.1 tripartite tricarboxylate transporter substrate binding protein [Rhodoferax sp.]MCW5628708.1 tripartite tricarboxylate transporter substrate binding protein [Rhodoferax sp.]